jgi:[glutamine synthetase] adenylyltransferase / [glutamine synthetase]-adenylyl-L-tyrosine phosphorylase
MSTAATTTELAAAPLNAIESAFAAASLMLPDDPRLHASLPQVVAASQFVSEFATRYPDRLLDLIESGLLWQADGAGDLALRLESTLANPTSESELMLRLRRFRQREMVRIIWRDLAGWATLQEVTGSMSDMAEAVLDQSLALLFHWQCDLWGTPYNSNGKPMNLVVLGMGKLGARELNLSSDIDLIFSYAEEGETRDGRRSTSHQEFFTRLGQRLIAVIDTRNAEGQVFRVDMRLRPFGQSGSLALSFDGMETYYQMHGRDWERYAMIKARVVAGDPEAGNELMTRLKPFVYRKYVDFGAFEAIREMKAMIEREVQRREMQDNVKLGPGGIREIEFIAQAFQLIRGGRDPVLQQRSLLKILPALLERNILPAWVVEELLVAYDFLRRVEHRLQAWADQQTHLLASEAIPRQRLAFSMDFADWASFSRQLERHRSRVAQHFAQVFAAPQGEESANQGQLNDLKGVWQGNLGDEGAIATLTSAGYRHASESYQRIQQLRQGRSFVTMTQQGRQRINRLLPLLLTAIGQGAAPDETLHRLLTLIESIGQRSAYIALLVENPMALSQLVRLCRASPWIANLLGRMPQLLDELLDPRTLYTPPRRTALSDELRQRLHQLEFDDLEGQMEAIRRFKQANVLRVAAADIMNALPLMVVSDHLTEIAEVTLEESMDLAFRALVAKHGRPSCGDSHLCDSGFAIIGYGKLGGVELGYGSDLDIVFLHSADSIDRQTVGEQPIDNPLFYARMAQKLIHILTARTMSGILYEVDTRLRPSGASGLLVSNLTAFHQYQQAGAWTWEHQALVRARYICGDEALGNAFNAIRREILCQPREINTLRQEVVTMREKMRSHLDKGKDQFFDLKQGAGGIVDIEFVVQYAVLGWAHHYPALTDNSDAIRTLEKIAACGILDQNDAQQLAEAYRTFRQRAHRLILQDQPAVIPRSEFAALRSAVVTIWHQLFNQPSPQGPS